MSKNHQTQLVARRGELMAELFLQELEADFVAQSTEPDFAFDFLIGFSNKNGGVNTYAVEVESTERLANDKYRVQGSLYDRLAHSNIPVLLLVVDVKQNVIFYAWPTDDSEPPAGKQSVTIPVTRVDDDSKLRLRTRMAG